MKDKPEIVKPTVVYGTQVISAPQTINALDKNFVTTLVGTTPSVKNVTFATSHVAPTTVTNFTKGQQAQVITILGNGNTTISNNTTIKTNTAASKVLAANKIYRFTYIIIAGVGVWYEDA
jgi:hypothetical protein